MLIKNKLFIKSLLNKIIPFKYRYSTQFRKNLFFLMESAKWDDRQYKAYQHNQLKTLLHNSCINNTYYSRIFNDLNITKEDILLSKDLYNEIEM